MPIILEDGKPVYQRVRRLSSSERNIVNSQIDECEDRLTTRLKRAQSGDEDIKRMLDALKQGQSSDNILRDGLLYKEVDNDVRLVPKSMQAQNDRGGLQIRARGNIEKIQRENEKHYDKRRKKTFCHREGDLVASKRTQQNPGLKLAPEYLGPHKTLKCLLKFCATIDIWCVRSVSTRDYTGPRQLRVL